MTKKNPLDDFYKLNSLISPNGINGFMGGLFAHMEKSERRQRNAFAGITSNEEGLFGVEGKIPFEYVNIEFKNKIYECLLNCNKTHEFDVYDKDCNLLFQADKFDNLKEGMFAVRIGERKNNDYDYAIYNGSKRVSDFNFRVGGLSSGFEGQFCEILYRHPTQEKYLSTHVVINKEGEIILKAEGSYSDYISIHKNIAFNGKKVFNLLTRELICEQTYSSDSTIKIKDEVFVKVGDNAVYKINKYSGEFEIFGTLPEPKKEVVYTPPVPKEKVVVLPKQQRNEICRCGSNKKVKHCNCKNNGG